MKFSAPAWQSSENTGVGHDYYSQLRPEIIEAIPENCSAVLDVGCGKGVLGRYLKDNGVDKVFGIELNEDAAVEARQWLDDVATGDLDSMQFPFQEKSVDCIICADVLEHLADPWTALAKLKRLLKDDGCIISSIPNVAFHRNIRKMLKGQWEYGDEGLLDRTHLRFFTFSTIEELFNSNGLYIEQVFKRVDAGWNIKLLNLLCFNKLKHTLYLHYIVRAQKS